LEGVCWKESEREEKRPEREIIIEREIIEREKRKC
jgi:hypothetical protein